MLFHRFSSQQERRAGNGSDFLEFQFCRLPRGTALCGIVNAEFCHWQLSSLYVSGDDFNLFWQIYADVFGPGLDANRQEGNMDCCDPNFYDAARTEEIIRQLNERKPADYQALLHWLEPGLQYNGFTFLARNGGVRSGSVEALRGGDESNNGAHRSENTRCHNKVLQGSSPNTKTQKVSVLTETILSGSAFYAACTGG